MNHNLEGDLERAMTANILLDAKYQTAITVISELRQAVLEYQREALNNSKQRALAEAIEMSEKIVAQSYE